MFNVTCLSGDGDRPEEQCSLASLNPRRDGTASVNGLPDKLCYSEVNSKLTWWLASQASLVVNSPLLGVGNFDRFNRVEMHLTRLRAISEPCSQQPELVQRGIEEVSA
jgi:hypothetical protein